MLLGTVILFQELHIQLFKFAHFLRKHLVYGSPNSSSSPDSDNSQVDLLRYTFAALAVGEVIGVFPEPRNVQVKDSETWAAVEYAKAMSLSGKEDKELVTVPAATVYTDKVEQGLWQVHSYLGLLRSDAANQ